MVDTFCPESELEAGEIRTLFIVMEAYKMSLSDVIENSEINESAYKHLFY